MMREKMFAIALAVLGAACLSGPVIGEDATSTDRQGGKYHLATGKTYNTHANDHARLLKKYASSGQAVPPVVVKEHLAGAQKQCAVGGVDRSEN